MPRATAWFFLLLGLSALPVQSGAPVLSPTHCPPLPPPAAPVVTVSSEAALRGQAYSASPGTYYLQDIVHVVHDGLTIRGATGHRQDVVLDMGGMGSGHMHGVLIDADDVTVNEWYRIRGTGQPVPTILFWSASSDTVVERNLLVDCSQGIAFGNSSHGPGDHVGGIVRNNMVYASLPHDVVIEMVHAEGWLVAHNTALLLNPAPGLDWGMESRFPDSQGAFAYNLTNLDIWPDRDGAQGTLSGNLTNAEAGWFVGAETGNLHLAGTATSAIDQAVPLDEVSDDFDGDPRPIGLASDVGADEVAPTVEVWIPFVAKDSH